MTKNKDVVKNFGYDSSGNKSAFAVKVGDDTKLSLHYSYDGESEGSKVQKRYICGNDFVYADKGGNTEKQYYVTDPHGNMVQLTDEREKFTNIYEYDDSSSEVHGRGNYGYYHDKNRLIHYGMENQ